MFVWLVVFYDNISSCKFLFILFKQYLTLQSIYSCPMHFDLIHRIFPLCMSFNKSVWCCHDINHSGKPWQHDSSMTLLQPECPQSLLCIASGRCLHTVTLLIDCLPCVPARMLIAIATLSPGKLEWGFEDKDSGTASLPVSHNYACLIKGKEPSLLIKNASSTSAWYL